MRLHLLEIDAFGPFAGHESVDFDDLTASGLFLLCGPTGAGKTSVLDAVCFALYGQVPGARALGAGRASLRSDHAAEGVAPQVVLDVTHGQALLAVHAGEFAQQGRQLALKRRAGVPAGLGAKPTDRRRGIGMLSL